MFYELLTGQSPFEAETAVETMHAVMSSEPVPVADLVPGLSAELEAIVRHCMEKDPRERFQSARDLAFQLRLVPEMRSGNSSASQRRRGESRRTWLIVLAAAVTTLAVAAGGLALYESHTAVDQATKARTFRQLTYAGGVELFPTLAPDGKTFAYVSSESGNRDLYLQRVDGRMATNLTADSTADESEPAFSPDGSSIAFRSERDGGGVFVMGVTGESVRRLTNFGHNPSWSPDGRQLAISTSLVELEPAQRRGRGQLFVIDVATGKARWIVGSDDPSASLGGSEAVQPSWSPHGTASRTGMS